MDVWSGLLIRSPYALWKAIRRIEQGDALICEFWPEDLSSEIVAAFKDVFPWQYNDTQRSYSIAKLRESGNRGKRTDFAYMNRATKYFRHNQFEAHRKQPNKLICLWDPSHDGDIVGEHSPCLVMIKFKKREKYLDMVATFRKRDLCRRMIGNWVFLSLWLNENAKLWKLKPGIITDFSMEVQWAEEDLAKLEKNR